MHAIARAMAPAVIAAASPNRLLNDSTPQLKMTMSPAENPPTALTPRARDLSASVTVMPIFAGQTSPAIPIIASGMANSETINAGTAPTST